MELWIKIIIEDIINTFEITDHKKYKCIRFLCDIEYKNSNSYNLDNGITEQFINRKVKIFSTKNIDTKNGNGVNYLNTII